MDLIFASNNSYKLTEIRKLLPEGYSLRTLNDIGCNEELPETGNTIEANALQKALHVFEHYHVKCFADDSGLEIEALDGAPGVHSAYYAGLPRNDENNIDLVLQQLKNKHNRKARFKTVIALINNGTPVLFEGILQGSIADVPLGKNGFGYDSVFVPEDYVKTLAELTADEKNKISHRARAVEKLILSLKF